MARQFKIDTQTLISLIGQYFVEECNNDASMLKIPAIGKYIRSKGYDVADYLIRRNDEAKNYIESLQRNHEETYINTVVVYRDIDIEAFLAKNNTRERLIKAIKEREGYYREITAAASHAFKEKVKLQNRIMELETENASLKNKLNSNQQAVSENKVDIKAYIAENKKLRDIIDTYIYPEIANELLKEQGLLKTTAGVVDVTAVKTSVITADTDVAQIKNNIVKGLFEKV